MISTREKKPDIQVESMDADGCWFKGAKSTFHRVDNTLEDFIQQNPSLYNHIRAQAQEFKGQTLFSCGSNRQSHAIDAVNSERGYIEGCSGIKQVYCTTPSYFPALQKLAATVSRDSNRNILLSQLLSPDIHHDREVGTSWYDKTLDLRKNSEERQLFDKEKVLLLFAQMHYYQQLYPEQTIAFNFYDDTETILTALHNTFKQYPELIPSNIQLNLFHHQHNGPIYRFKAPIQGTQQKPLDFRYHTQVLTDILETTSPEKDGEYRGSNVIQLLAKKNELSNFLQSSREKPFDLSRLGITKRTSAAEFKETPACQKQSVEMKVEVKASTGTTPPTSTTDEFMPWLQKQFNHDELSKIPKPGQVLYSKGLAWSYNSSPTQAEFLSALQIQRKQSPQQIMLTYAFEKTCEAKDMDSEARCLNIENLLLNWQWNTKKGGTKFKVSEFKTVTLPSAAHVILARIHAAKKNQNWDAALQDILAAGKCAADSKPTFAMFSGGKRDEVTQHFYDLLKRLSSSLTATPALSTAPESKR